MYSVCVCTLSAILFLSVTYIWGNVKNASACPFSIVGTLSSVFVAQWPLPGVSLPTKAMFDWVTWHLRNLPSIQ